MKKIFFMLMLGSMVAVSSVLAYSIDEYGRNVAVNDYGYGGHVSKHIGKSHNELRGECNGRKINKFFTSYPTTSTAEGTLYKMINTNRANREQVNDFQRNRGNGVRSNIQGDIYRAHRRWYSWRTKYRSAYGRGIDCNKLGEVTTKRSCKWWRPCYTKVTYHDEYNYLRKAKANLKFNFPHDKWYIQTSYPTR